MLPARNPGNISHKIRYVLPNVDQKGVFVDLSDFGWGASKVTRFSWHRRGNTSDQPNRGRTLRNVAIVGALVTLSTGGAVVLSNSAFSDPANGQKLTICHATRSNNNPYVQITPSINATGLHGGHINHTGPIWDPTIKAGGGSWGDIIPPFTYQPKAGPPVNYPGLNWTAEGQAIYNNGCNIPVVPTTVTPENPTITQASCNSDNNLVDPTITLANTPHVTYSASPAGPYTAGEKVVITATAETPGFQFVPPAPGKWVFVNSTTETLTIHLHAAPSCTVTVTPVAPTVTQSVCDGTTPTPPTVDLQTTTGITYTEDTPPVAGGTTIVTATANAGYKFVSPGPGKWVFVNDTTETYTIHFDAAPDCTLPATGVAPENPTVTQATCVGDPSQLVGPTLSLASGPAGVTYSTSASAPFSGGESVTVTATADGTHEFSAPGHDGWTFVDAHHETFGVTFDASPTCSGNLANTGVNSVQLGEIGGIVLLFGIGLQFLSMGMRRRPTA